MTKFSIYKTEIGNVQIGYDGDYITFVKKVSDDLPEGGERVPLTELAFSQLQEFFEGKRKEFTLPLKLIGTEFQMKVWRVLQDIPYGTTCSYKDIAIAVGRNKGFQAVGMANNKNPISFIVPCHRVIGADGKMVGYGGGVDLKIKLLEIEKRNK